MPEENLNPRLLANPEPVSPLVSIRTAASAEMMADLEPRHLSRIMRQAENGDSESYLTLAERMEERDLHYAAVLGVRKRQVAQLELSVEAADDDSAEAKRDAELLRAVVGSGVIQEALFDVLDAVGKGFSVTEVIWQTAADRWTPKRLAWVDPRWLAFGDGDREMRLKIGLDQTAELAPGRFLSLFIGAKSGLPIRGGLARIAAWSHIVKHFTLASWVQFCEIYGHPLRLGRYHAGASDEEKRTLKRAVTAIARDAAAIVPETMGIEFVASGQVRANAELYEKLVNYSDQQISKAVLGQTATTDAIKGSYAVGSVHDRVRDDIARSDANELENLFNRQLVPVLIALNHGERKAYPRLLIGRGESVDAEIFSQVVERAGRVPGLTFSAEAMRKKLGLEAPNGANDTAGLAVGSAQAQPATAPNSAPAALMPALSTALSAKASSGLIVGQEKPSAAQHAFHSDSGGQSDSDGCAICAAHGDPAVSDPDSLDLGADRLAEDWEPLGEDIGAAIAQAASSDELRAAVDNLMSKFGVEELSEALAQAGFVAAIAGRVGFPISDPDPESDA